MDIRTIRHLESITTIIVYIYLYVYDPMICYKGEYILNFSRKIMFEKV